MVFYVRTVASKKRGYFFIYVELTKYELYIILNTTVIINNCKYIHMIATYCGIAGTYGIPLWEEFYQADYNSHLMYVASKKRSYFFI